MKKFYISTAIAYTSGKPHIGNTYEIVLSDAIARYKRLQGYDVYFQTGTDEHGEKIQSKSQELGIGTQEYVDEIAGEIKRIWSLMDTSFDNFIRTTDPLHKKKVQDIYQKLYDQGDIYLGEYEGFYCTPCESFFSEDDLVDGMCPDCNRSVVIKKEEAYFFKLSKYQDRLIKYIEDNPTFIHPIQRKNEMLNTFLKDELPDLCVSRTSFDWGIKLPFDEKHVAYVWIDALSNYITFIDYDVNNITPEFKSKWPADIHIIGKDILRFHTIYWPTLLMALDIELPKQVFGHPWLLMAGEKISKSRGNVMYADDLVRQFSVDIIRFYLLHEIPYSSDGTITYPLIIERSNSELSNVLGNLVNRTLSMGHKYFEGNVYNQNVNIKEDQFIEDINKLEENCDNYMEDLRVANALEEVFKLYRKANKFIDETEPWKEESEVILEQIIYNILEAIRVATVFLSPFLPATSKEIFKQLNINDMKKQFNKENNYSLGDAKPVFKRIDMEKKLKEIEEEISENN